MQATSLPCRLTPGSAGSPASLDEPQGRRFRFVPGVRGEAHSLDSRPCIAGPTCCSSAVAAAMGLLAIIALDQPRQAASRTRTGSSAPRGCGCRCSCSAPSCSTCCRASLWRSRFGPSRGARGRRATRVAEHWTRERLTLVVLGVDLLLHHLRQLPEPQVVPAVHHRRRSTTASCTCIDQALFLGTRAGRRPARDLLGDRHRRARALEPLPVVPAAGAVGAHGLVDLVEEHLLRLPASRPPSASPGRLGTAVLLRAPDPRPRLRVPLALRGSRPTPAAPRLMEALDSGSGQRAVQHGWRVPCSRSPVSRRLHVRHHAARRADGAVHPGGRACSKWIFWVNFGVTVIATLYFGRHYVADDIAGWSSPSSPSTSAASPPVRSSTTTASPPTPPPRNSLCPRPPDEDAAEHGRTFSRRLGRITSAWFVKTTRRAIPEKIRENCSFCDVSALTCCELPAGPGDPVGPDQAVAPSTRSGELTWLQRAAERFGVRALTVLIGGLRDLAGGVRAATAPGRRRGALCRAPTRWRPPSGGRRRAATSPRPHRPRARPTQRLRDGVDQGRAGGRGVQRRPLPALPWPGRAPDAPTWPAPPPWPPSTGNARAYAASLASAYQLNPRAHRALGHRPLRGDRDRRGPGDHPDRGRGQRWTTPYENLRGCRDHRRAPRRPRRPTPGTRPRTLQAKTRQARDAAGAAEAEALPRRPARSRMSGTG